MAKTVDGLEGEIWKPVAGWGGKYEVSNKGRVKSYHRKEPVIMKHSINPDGYASVEFYNTAEGQHYKRIKVATIVAEAFLGPRPPGLVVCHNDGSRDNDELSNLRYGTHKENIRDKEKHGTLKTPNNRGEKHGNAKLTLKDVEWMFAADLHGMPRQDIAKRLQIAPGQVTCILNGSRWKEALKGHPWYKPRKSPLRHRRKEATQ